MCVGGQVVRHESASLLVAESATEEVLPGTFRT